MQGLEILRKNTYRCQGCGVPAPTCSWPGSKCTERAPLASKTFSSEHLRLAGPGKEQQNWIKLKHVKASLPGTNARVAFFVGGGKGKRVERTTTSYNSEETKGQDLGHIREGTPERLYIGEERSRRAIGYPKLMYRSRQ